MAQCRLSRGTLTDASKFLGETYVRGDLVTHERHILAGHERSDIALPADCLGLILSFLFEELVEDFNIMVANAHHYNKSNSLIFHHASRIKTLVNAFAREHSAKLQSESSGPGRRSRNSLTNGPPIGYGVIKDALLEVIKGLLEVKDAK